MLIDLVTVLAVVEERNAVILVGHINPVVSVNLELCLVIRIVSVRTALHCGVGDISCVVLRLKINVKEYLEELFKRGAYLGIKYFVFGSSGARRIPEGMSLEEGRAQIVDFLKRLVVPVAEKYNIRVAIEPLRPAECNAINTVADGIEVAKKVDSPYVKVLADVKHMYEQNEDFKLLYDYKGWVIHAHTSNPDPDPSLNKKRIYPKAGDKFDQRDFIEPLKAIGVECVSIEADVIDFPADAAEAYKILRPLAED